MAPTRGIGVYNIFTGYGDRLSNSSKEKVKQMIIRKGCQLLDFTTSLIYTTAILSVGYFPLSLFLFVMYSGYFILQSDERLFYFTVRRSGSSCVDWCFVFFMIIWCKVGMKLRAQSSYKSHFIFTVRRPGSSCVYFYFCVFYDSLFF